jgi:hypothetical protein
VQKPKAKSPRLVVAISPALAKFVGQIPVNRNMAKGQECFELLRTLIKPGRNWTAALLFPKDGSDDL